MSLPLVISRQAAITPKPTEGSLHDPAPWQHFEGMQFVAFNDFDGATPQFLGQLDQGACITSVGPDMLDPTPGGLPKEGGQQELGSVPVLNVGGQNHYGEQQANRIDQDMPLAPIDFLARIIATFVAAFTAFDALAIDDRRTGLAVASRQQARGLPQVGVDLHPETIAFPEAKVMVDGAPRGKVTGQVAPLAPGCDHIEHRVEQFPVGMLTPSAPCGGLRKAVFNQLPFTLSQVRCISHPELIEDCGTRYKLSLQKSFRFFKQALRSLAERLVQ